MTWVPPQTSGTVHLRLAGPEDVPRIREIELASQPSPWSDRVILQELDVPQSSFWLASVDAEVVGFLVFWVVYDEIHILNVAVDPKVRRRGVARALLACLLERARSAEMTSVTLEVRVSNVAAQRLYEAFGFRRIGQRKAYYADNGEDAFILASVLEEATES